MKAEVAGSILRCFFFFFFFGFALNGFSPLDSILDGFSRDYFVFSFFLF